MGNDILEIRDGLANHESRLEYLEALHFPSNAHLRSEPIARASDLSTTLDILKDEMEFTDKQKEEIHSLSEFLKNLSGRVVQIEEYIKTRTSTKRYKY
jgi:hypothetical protein